jgi:hypothetical protein
MVYLLIGMKSETAGTQRGRTRAFDLFWTEVDSPKNHQGGKTGGPPVETQPKFCPSRASSAADSLSGFEIAPSFEVSEEGGLHGTPTEAFLS